MHELKGGFNMVGFSQGGQFLRVSSRPLQAQQQQLTWQCFTSCCARCVLCSPLQCASAVASLAPTAQFLQLPCSCVCPISCLRSTTHGRQYASLLLLAFPPQAVVQRCGHTQPPVHSLITLGGQHQGVANTPGCSVDLTGAAAKACTAMQLLLARGAYAPWVRENIVQAQYFKVRRGLAMLRCACTRICCLLREVLCGASAPRYMQLLA
eukprot:GHRQ01024629.1.p1 GENE.GHRQ01024629.1~~GHRQ01024629.1.p1  ORF type:complete len:209 (-),score=45.53 GHRQ01024629.1:66-692(-)